MQFSSRDSDALIERLKTGNEPPGDVPFIQLDVPDPPPCSTQLSAHTSGENGYTEKSSRRKRSSSIVESGDSGIHYASIQVSPAVGRVSSPFTGADPIIEPTECHKLTATPTTACPSLGRPGRRFSVSLGSKEGNTGNGHNFLWRVFTRRSKSREGERRSESLTHGRPSISQSPRESPKQIEMVTVGDNRDKENTEESILTNLPDVDAGSNLSVPTIVPLSIPLVNSSRSTQEKTQVAELTRSLSSPSSSSNDFYGSKTKLTYTPTVSQPESASPERCSVGMTKSSSQNGAHYQGGTIVGTTPGSNTAQEKSPRATSPRRNAYHQPKRQHENHHHQPNKRNSDNKMAHRSSMSDLIAVGTCKALYDFESSQYGETFISFKFGDELRLISSNTKWHGSPDTDGWIYAETIPPVNDPKAPARRGFIPASFVEITLYPEPQPLTLPRKRDIDDGSNFRGSHSNLRSDKSFLALGQATEL
nr:src region,src domain [Hymenolepis microstoma]